MRVDCHCDTVMYSRREGLWKNPERHCDFCRLRQVVDIQFMAVFPYLDKIPAKDREQIPVLTEELIGRLVEAATLYDNAVGIIRCREDMVRLEKQGRLGLLISIEGGEALDGELTRLEHYFHLGVRAIGLTWNYENDLAWGASSRRAR